MGSKVTGQECMNGPYEDITKEHKEDNNNEDDNNNIVINASSVLANIQLAETVGEWIYVLGFLF